MKLAFALAATAALTTASSAYASTTTLACSAAHGLEYKVKSGGIVDTTTLPTFDLVSIDQFELVDTTIGAIRLATSPSENDGTDLTIAFEGINNEEGRVSCGLMYYKGYDLLGSTAGIAPKFFISKVSVDELTASKIELKLTLNTSTDKFKKVLVIERTAPRGVGDRRFTVRD